MKIRLSTSDAPPGEGIDFWQDMVCSTFVQADCRTVGDRPFHGTIEATGIEGMTFSRLVSREQEVVRSASHVRRSADEMFMVNLQLRGTGTFVQDDREVTLRPGDLACTDSTRTCAMAYSDDFEQLILAVPRMRVTEALGSTTRLTATCLGGKTPLGSLISGYLATFAGQIDRFDPTMAARLGETGLSLVLTALGEMAGLGGTGQPWGRHALRERARQWIDRHARDPELTSAAVALALGISQRYLQELFREVGTSPGEWIWRRRLEIARRDLADPATGGVAQVAFACGFSDAAHFSRRFRQAFGLSPSAWRAALMEGAFALAPGAPPT